MILISTLRKMLAKDSTARVVRHTVKAHQIKLSGGVVEVSTRIEFYATERQAYEAFIRAAWQLRQFGVESHSELNLLEDVSANDAAIAQGFDFLGAA